MLWVRNGYMGNSLQALWYKPYWEDELTNTQWLQGIVTSVPNIMSHTVRKTKTTSGRIRQCPSILSSTHDDQHGTWKQSLWKRRTPWKINMEPTNHPFWKENDLPNLQYRPLLGCHVNFHGCIPPWSISASIWVTWCHQNSSYKGVSEGQWIWPKFNIIKMLNNPIKHWVSGVNCTYQYQHVYIYINKYVCKCKISNSNCNSCEQSITLPVALDLTN